jgi:hypothetical protein
MKLPAILMIPSVVLAGFLFALAPGLNAADKTSSKTPSCQKTKVRAERFCYYNPPQAEVFALGSDLIIQVGTNSNATLADLTVGKTARIGYTVDNGVFIAHTVSVKGPNKPNNSQKYACGPILAVNASAGTITIKYRR